MSFLMLLTYDSFRNVGQVELGRQTILSASENMEYQKPTHWDFSSSLSLSYTSM